jgi:hypothetical protein
MLREIRVQMGDADPGTVVYVRAVDEDTAAAYRLVRASLPGQVFAWATRVAPDEPVYCVGLRYDFAEPRLAPPALGLATDDDRKRALAEPDPENRRRMLWDPAEWRLLDHEPDELYAEPLITAWAALMQAYRSTGSAEDVRRLLITCARAAWTEFDWSAITHSSPFAVYAVDDQFIDFERNLHDTVDGSVRATIEGRDLAE